MSDLLDIKISITKGSALNAGKPAKFSYSSLKKPLLFRALMGSILLALQIK